MQSYHWFGLTYYSVGMQRQGLWLDALCAGLPKEMLRLVHVTGKFSVDAVHNLKKDGPVFEFDGTAKEAELKSKKGLNRIYEMIAENPNINQSEIIKALNLPKGNVSRDISKLIKRGLIEGDPSEGYTLINKTDNLDNLDN